MVEIESHNTGSVGVSVLRVLWILMPFLFFASRGSGELSVASLPSSLVLHHTNSRKIP